MDLIKKIHQCFFSKNIGSKKIFLGFREIFPKSFFDNWQEYENISSKDLAIRIFALLIETNIELSLLLAKGQRFFSFSDFCKNHLGFEYKSKKMELVSLEKYNFLTGDIIYLLQKNKEEVYEAFVYEKS